MKKRFTMCALALAIAGAGMAVAQAPAAPDAPKTRSPKTKAEQEALQKLLQAATPDAQIAEAEDFVVKFPSSDYKALAYLGEAQSYQQKGDYDHLVVAGEQSLESDPDDGTKVQVFTLLARSIALKTGEFDLDREEKLSKVEKYSNSALDMLKTMPKPNPSLPDEQWAAAKGGLIAQAHEALGLDQMARKDYAKAATEFKAACEATNDTEPSYGVRLALAYDKGGKYDDAIAACDKVLASPNLHPMVKRAAESQKAHAAKAKGGAAPAAAKP